MNELVRKFTITLFTITLLLTLSCHINLTNAGRRPLLACFNKPPSY
ncbi:hypothetical protein FHS81_002900 [Pseudochelatococcus contaminans]|uniref:Uncharacterized protein n=1 Tax=Pseudochelatococcus contaminans TaxID=1538103 RepID=A0A7W5Z6B0_9HYPH|nr:hypothetical protein [Pseudochelatococcus contaminans]